MKKQDWLLKILVWREKHIKEKNFILILSFIIGVLGASAAFILKEAIHIIQLLLTDHFSNEKANYMYLLYPVIGLLLSSLYVRFVVKDNISHGVTRVLYAISQHKSRLKKHNMYSSVIASSITIGFGGSVGAEAPIVYTGAAIGSNLGRVCRLDPRTLMLMVGCGAAAGIAGIFKAPFAGLLFTIEVLMLDFTAATIMPLIVSSATAATITYLLSDGKALFAGIPILPFTFDQLGYVLALGVFCGFVSLYFTRMIYFLERQFKRLRKPIWRFIAGSAILSTTIFFLPPLYGEGYDSITVLLQGDARAITEGSFFYAWKESFTVLAVYLALIVLLKVFATAATNGGGGVGGTFAPSLYVGCMAGFLFAFVANRFDIFSDTLLSTTNFALMGMAGVMAGVMHAPLMALFLTAELTGGYSLFLPLMITSAVAFWTIRIFESHSIYTMRLAKNGELITHHKDKAVLTLLKIDSVIETDFLAVKPEMTLGDMVKVIAKSHRNIFPVVDEENKMLGIVLLDDIRNIMFRPALYERFKVQTFMTIPPAKIVINTPMEQVMKIFDETNAWNLPVVDENGEYIGFVSKSKIFNSYRRVLVHYSQD